MLGSKKSKQIAVATLTASKKRSTDTRSGKVADSLQQNHSLDEQRRLLTREHVLANQTGGNEPAELLRSLGDHINTRLQEIGSDEDLDADLFQEKKRQLMEEARLAAGTQHRVLSEAILNYLTKSQPIEDTAWGAAQLHMVRVHHNSNSITAVSTLGLDLVVLGDKSGKVYVAELAVRSNVGNLHRDQGPRDHSKYLLEPTLGCGVVSLAVSDTRQNRPTTRDLYEKTTTEMSCTSYLAAGAEDGSISIWETASRKHKGLLFMHRKAVTGLSFRISTAELYSCSDDGTLRVWNVPDMISVDVLFGHEGKVYSVHGLRKETCATVGSDLTMRFWKIDAATQQSYQYLMQYRDANLAEASVPASNSAPQKSNSVPISLEVAAMLNERLVLVGATDGSLVLFDVNRRRPLTVVPVAHGYDALTDGTGIEKAGWEVEKDHKEAAPSRRIPNPISAVATVPYADVVASASYDGRVRLWRVLNAVDVATADTAATQRSHTSKPSNSAGLVCIGELPVGSLVTSLQFSMDSDVIFIACSKESRRGRWFVQKSALNSICVVPLTLKGEKAVTRGVSHAIEHVPALLYHYEDDEPATSEEERNEIALSLAERPPQGLRGSKRDQARLRADEFESEEDAIHDHAEAHLECDEDEEQNDFFKVGEHGQFMLSHDEKSSHSPAKASAEGKTGIKKKVSRKLASKKLKGAGMKKKNSRKAPALQHPTKRIKKLRKTQ